MAKSGVTMTKDNADALLKSLRALTKKEVLIGIPGIESSRYETNKQADEARTARKAGQTSPHQSLEGLTNPEIGYLMETGIPEKNVPARPFLEPGVIGVTDKLGATLERGVVKTLSGDKQAADVALNRAGLIGAAAVQQKITDGPFVPLSPVTLERRKSKGRTGETPLIDTGQLRAAVSYAVRPKGK